MLEDEFLSSDNFEDAALETTSTAELEQQANTEAFEEARNDVLGVENPVEVTEPKSAFSDDVFKALVEKANKLEANNAEWQTKFDKVFGTVGQLQHEIKNLRQQPAATPITKDRFAKITEYFGDDELATALAEDFGSLTLTGQGQSFDSEAFKTEQLSNWDSREQRLRTEFETKLLGVAHPDWKELVIKSEDESGVVHTDEFNAWKNSLKPETQQTLLASNDGMQLIKAINEFKSWKGKKADFEQKKQQRLADAVPIKGGGGRANQNNMSDFDSAKNAILNRGS